MIKGLNPVQKFNFSEKLNFLGEIVEFGSLSSAIFCLEWVL